MFRTHIRKIVGDLRKYKLRTVLVAVSIFVGVLGTVTLFSMGDIIVRQLEADLQPEKMAMLSVELSTVDASALDNTAHLAALAGQPDVAALQAYADYEITLEAETVLVRAYSTPLDALPLEPLRLLDGRYPAAGQSEVAITRELADAQGLDVGDSIALKGTAQQDRFVISGIVFPTYDQPEAGQRVTVFATWDDLQTLSGRGDFTALQVRFTDYTEANAQQVVQALAQTTPYIPIAQRLVEPEANEQLEEARTNSRVLRLLAVIALVVSGFLVANVISSLITEQRTQIGMLKTLGAGPGDLLGIYTGVAASYGLAGIVPGVLLGIPAGNYAAHQLSGTLGTYIDGFAYSLTAVVYGALLGLAVPVLAALFPVIRALRVTILRAMADRGIEATYGVGRGAQFIARIPVPATIRQSLNNLNRQKARLFFTLITMMIAVTAFMGIYAMLDSVVGLITSALDTIQADIIIRLDDPADYDTVVQLLPQEIDGVRSVQPGIQLAIDIEGYDPSGNIGPEGIAASGFDVYAASAPYQITLKSGTLWDANTPDNGIIITRRMAEAVGVGVGDTLTITIAGKPVNFPVIGVSTYPFDNVFMDWRVLALAAGFVRQGEPVSAAIMVMMDGDLNTAEIDAVIDNIQAKLDTRSIGASYQNFQARSEMILSRADIFRAIFSAAVLLIAMTGALGLLTTLSISVFERRREIGIMRSIGASSSAIGMQFLTEGVVVGLAAWIAGIPLSIGLSLQISSVMNFGDAFHLTYPLESVLFGLIGMVIITVTASLYPALAAAQQSVSRILRYQ